MTMKKTTMLMIGLLALVLIGGTALALTLTQEQYDNVNFDNQNLNAELVSVSKDESTLLIEYRYTTLRETSPETYTDVIMQGSVTYNINRYYACRLSGNSASECKQRIKKEVIEEIKNVLAAEKNYLEQQKTNQLYQEINPNELSITNEEIN